MTLRGGLYLLADTTALPPERWPAIVPTVLDAGPVLVQFRAKTQPAATRRHLARQLLDWCTARDIPLLINDDPSLCHTLGAAGVHLGAHDPAVATARRELGPTALIGVSCYGDPERAHRAAAAGADYLSFGRLFPSRTKPKARALPAGFLPQIRAAVRLPLCAIGGIDPDNAPAVLAAGADLLCVAGGIWSAPDPAAAAARLVAHCRLHFSDP